jgi:hypothetical protein
MMTTPFNSNDLNKLADMHREASAKAAAEMVERFGGDATLEDLRDERSTFAEQAAIFVIGGSIVAALERIEKKLDVLVGDDGVTAPDDVEMAAFRGLLDEIVTRGVSQHPPTPSTIYLGASQVNAVEDPETGRRVLRRFDIED